jgi:repressor LexA
MVKLTRRQSEVVLFVRRYADRFGFPPSRREIAEKFGVSVNAITGHLAAAERKGAITRSANIARGLVVHAATDRPKTRRGDRAHAKA